MKKPSAIESLSQIVALTHQFQKIQRIIHIVGENRFENDAEHSFQLAFIAWYLIEKESLPLDKEKVLTYALCHDIAEVYAGDVSFYRTKKEDKEKVSREKEAIKKLTKKYPYFPALTDTIHAYEAKKDDESNFIYALDKLLPIINIKLDGGRTWHSHNITLEKLYEGKISKVAYNPIIEKYFILLIELLKKNPHLFPKK